jgi:hypothetical protein
LGRPLGPEPLIPLSLLFTVDVFTGRQCDLIGDHGESVISFTTPAFLGPLGLEPSMAGLIILALLASVWHQIC